MSVFEYIIGVILIVFALLVIFVVLLQEGRQANVGVISGAAENFMDKGAAKTLDKKLAKWTKVIAITFFVLVLAGMMVSKFLSKDALDAAKKDNSTTTSTTSTTTTTTGSDATTTTTGSDTTTTTTAASSDVSE